MWFFAIVLLMISMPWFRYALEILFMELTVHFYHSLNAFFVVTCLVAVCAGPFAIYMLLTTETKNDLCVENNASIETPSKPCKKSKSYNTITKIILGFLLLFPINSVIAEIVKKENNDNNNVIEKRTLSTKFQYMQCDHADDNKCINNPLKNSLLAKDFIRKKGYCIGIGGANMISVEDGSALPTRFNPISVHEANKRKYGNKFSEWSKQSQENLKMDCPIFYQEIIVNRKQDLLCCDEEQYGDVHTQVSMIPAECTACGDNLKNVWCQYACHPDQSLFLDVKQIRHSPEKQASAGPIKEKTNVGVFAAESLIYYVTNKFASDLYNYCLKDFIFTVLCQKGSCTNGFDILNFMGAYKLNDVGSPSGIQFKGNQDLDDELCPCDEKTEKVNCFQPLNSKLKSCSSCGSQCDIDQIKQNNKRNKLLDLPTCKVVTNDSNVAIPGGTSNSNNDDATENTEENIETPLSSEKEDWMNGQQELYNYLQKGMDDFNRNDYRSIQILLFLFIFAFVVIFGTTLFSHFRNGGNNDTGKSYINSIVTNNVPNKVDVFLRKKMNQYGNWLCTGRRSIFLMCLSLLLCFILVFGIVFKMDIETDPVELWSNKESSSYKSEKRYNALFQPFYRTSQIILTAKTGINIGNPEFLEQALVLQNKIKLLNHPDYFSIIDKIKLTIKNKNNSEVANQVPVVSDLLDEFRDNIVNDGDPQTYIKRKISTIKEYFVSDEAIKQELDTLVMDDSPDDHRNVTLQDICWKATGNACTITSVTQFFQNNLLHFNYYKKNNNVLKHLEECLNSPAFPDKISCAKDNGKPPSKMRDCTCFSDYGAPMDLYRSYLGGFPDSARDSPKYYTQSKALFISYLLLNHNEKEANERAIKWERDFIDFMNNYASNPSDLFSVSFMASISIQDEIEKESKGDTIPIMLSYLLMLLYVTIGIGFGQYLKKKNQASQLDNKKKKIDIWYYYSIGFFGVIFILLAVASTIGLFSYFNVKVQLIIMEVVPFLTLAIGVDNIFLIFHSLQHHESTLLMDDANNSEYTAKLISSTLESTGPSIIMASLSESLIFSLGCISKMPAVMWFAAFSSVAIIINLILQMTLFVSYITIIKKKQFSGACPNAVSIPTPHTKNHRLSHSPFLFYWSKLLGNKIVRCVILLMFILSSLLSIYSYQFIKLGLLQEEAMPSGSYLISYFQNINDYLSTGPPIYFVTQRSPDEDDINEISKYDNNQLFDNILNKEFNKDICLSKNFCSLDSIPNVLKLLGTGNDDKDNALSQFDFSSVSRISSDTKYSWLDKFWEFSDPSRAGCCRVTKTNPPTFVPASNTNQSFDSNRYKNTRTCLSSSGNADVNEDTPAFGNMEEFISIFKMFAKSNAGPTCASGGGSIFRNQFSINNEPIIYDEDVTLKVASDGNKNNEEALTAFSYMVLSNACRTQSDWIKTYKQSLRIADWLTKRKNIKVWPYSIFFIYFEQYLTIKKDMFLLLGLALAIIFLLNCIYFQLVIVPFIITLVIANIVLCVIGLMSVNDIYLNGLSLVNLIIAAGISIEFTLHYVKVYVTEKPDYMNVFRSRGKNKMLNAFNKIFYSVFFGIGMTKIIGLSVLTLADSRIFIKYYFKMYIIIVSVGLAHGLILLPILLALYTDYIEPIFNKNITPPLSGSLDEYNESKTTRYSVMSETPKEMTKTPI